MGSNRSTAALRSNCSNRLMKQLCLVGWTRELLERNNSLRNDWNCWNVWNDWNRGNWLSLYEAQRIRL
jgi:hypothetical protein